ncbi:MAG: hypothetical protein ACEPOW_03335 [Bacteroidales bacterium]
MCSKQCPTLYLILLLVIIPSFAYSQFFSSGQDPASYRWKILKTDKVKVIYPEQMSPIAQRIARNIHLLSPIETGELNAPTPRRFPIILHMGSSVSNAFVSYAPRRMEFFPVPSQDGYGQNWYDQLSLHEYRHVIQLQKMRQGLGKILYWGFGQQATGALFGVFVPRWLAEGDAVVTESVLSKTGRASQASFIRTLRTQVIQQGIFNYNKAVFGSYNRFVPDPYVLGYHLCVLGRNVYGNELWTNVFDQIGRNPWKLSPLSRGLKKVTGLTTTQYYNETMKALKQRWEFENGEITNPNITHILPKDTNTEYANYRFIHPINKHAFYALKDNIEDILHIVKNENGKETIIATPGYGTVTRFSMAQNLICWNESRNHPRWSNKNYSVVKIFNIDTKKSYTIGKKKRWYAPCLSKDAKWLIATQVEDGNLYSIIVYSLEQKRIIYKLKSAQNLFYQYPCISDDKSKIAAVTYINENKRIVEFKLPSGGMDFLFTAGFTDINYPAYDRNNLFFVANYNGLENIYYYNRIDNHIDQITYENFGATYPFATSNRLFFSRYDAKGFAPVFIERKDIHKTPLKDINRVTFDLSEEIRLNTDTPLNQELDTTFVEKKYNRLWNLFNIHSWAPIYISGISQEAGIGASILSQNLLSTSTLELGYDYNYNQNRGKWIAKYIYSGWYPRLSFNLDYGERFAKHFSSSNGRIYRLYWNELNFNPQISIPLNITHGPWSTSIIPYAGYEYKKLNYLSRTEARYTFNELQSYSAQLTFANQYKSTPKDYASKWLQRIDLVWKQSPDNKTRSEIYALTGKFAFPGIWKHHSLILYSGYQHKDLNVFSYSDVVLYPRGISDQDNDDLFSIRTTYGLPIAFPNWSVGKLLYMKRIEGALFFDYAQGKIGKYTKDYMTTGFEIVTESHYLRFFAPIQLGIRPAYDIRENEFSFQLLFGVNLYSY